MSQSYPNKTGYTKLHSVGFNKKTAIHKAGHAAAIYLGNKQKQLPPIFFQIFIKELNNEAHGHGCHCSTYNNHFAWFEGGRMFHTLPSSIQKALRHYSTGEKQAYQCNIETAIINLLVGPLAEAKYVALCDDEPITPRLVNLDSLRYYGGSSDLEVAYEYLDCLLIDQEQKKKKIFELFLAAYDLINNKSNWNAIIALSDYIENSGKKIIECEEVIAVLDEQLA